MESSTSLIGPLCGEPIRARTIGPSQNKAGVRIIAVNVAEKTFRVTNVLKSVIAVSPRKKATKSKRSFQNSSGRGFDSKPPLNNNGNCFGEVE